MLIIVTYWLSDKTSFGTIFAMKNIKSKKQITTNMNQTILRNLFYTLKRFRTASVLNLLGLSTAFAAFIVIMMKASYEQQFDTCYPDYERLAVLNLSIDGKDNELVVVPRPFVDAAIQETTGIECGTLLDHGNRMRHPAFDAIRK